MAPEAWISAHLGAVATITMGQAPPSTDVAESGDGLPFIQGNAEFGFRHPSPKKICRVPLKVAEVGDVLVSVRAPVGALNVADRRLAIGRGLAAIRLHGIDGDFGWHAIAAASVQLQRVAQGSTFEAVNRDNLAAMVLPLPPLAEQRKIAAILSSVDETIEKTEAVIAQLDVVKKAMLEELLTRGIPGRHSRFKQTEIGEVPAEWEVAILGEACEFLDGQRVPIKASDRASMQGDVPYYGASGVVDWVNAHLFDEPLVLLSEDGANILTRSSPVAFKIAGRSWVNNHAHVLRPLPDWDHDFLVEYLQSIDYADYSTGTAQPKLNKQVCLGIEVPKPSASEQREIGSIVRALDERLAAERVGLRAASDLKASLSFALLTGELRIHVQAGGM